MTTLDTPRGPAAPERDGSRTERWYGRLDAVTYVGALNLLVVAFTLAGGIVLGWAPALAAAAACSRTRLRGDTQQLLRAFASRWRRQFVHANLLAAPSGLVLAVLGWNLAAAEARWLQVALVAAVALCLAHLLLAVTMDAHYELRRGRCLRLAWEFGLRFPGAPLLLIATTALIGAITAFVPGLAPVLSVGVWIHLCTALCLSFFAANDRNLPGAA
ncbi:DUF624 domain-containing protein [Glycomyces dulcitolivorans]|uniref:DUF624 domain-containing protein n=1 Tax=Glycomyces dulcitolivorans TaxID=2200759 RepID=UPI0013009D2D|nr:DUF624 domain-containing protein [Glycomyces dulcitolivorans]